MTPDGRAVSTGTLTFFFSDIEGSTRLTQRLGPVGYRDLLERHQALLRATLAAHAGTERGTEGDSFFVVFTDTAHAIGAAVDAQRTLAQAAWPEDEVVRVRIGLHTGAGVVGGDDYVGVDVNRAARIAAAAHGGQVLLSDATRVLSERDLPAGVSIRDLGAHRLKDLDRPERLYQLVIDGLRSDFPPPRTLSARAGNLPPRLTSFVDREGEREALNQLLGESRLVTITGPGGTGKSSLAVAVAAAIASRFDDGAWFVPLDSLSDPELVPTAIARAFGLEVEDHRSPFERVADYVRERRLLLVLDNFEHLQPAARVVRALVEDAAAVQVLVASQAPLHLVGEQEFPLEPLPVPHVTGAGDTADDMAANPAVRLFVDRARSVRPGFVLDGSNVAAIAAICTRLDGLPLAIELAAAQVRVLSPAAILDRLSKQLTTIGVAPSDVPERQRTLEALVAWSYDRLPEDQRSLLLRLAVFAGGAGLGEIERIAEGVAAIPDPMTALAGLVDRSLVRVDPHAADRYSLLETIRAFAAGRLHHVGEGDDVERRHAEIMADLVEEAEPNLYRADRRAWLARLALDHDNVRVALDRMEAGELTIALRIAAAVWRFWQQAGHLAEGIPRIERLLGAAQATRVELDPLLMSRVEEAAGGMGYWERVRDPADIEQHYERSLAFARQSGDEDREAWAIYNLSFAYDYIPSSEHRVPPQPERAEALREDALAQFRALGDERGVAYTLWAMSGSPMAIVKPLNELRAGLTAALERFRRLGEAFGESWALLSLAMVEAENGNLEGSQSAIVDAGNLFVRDGDLSGQMVIVEALAALAARSGDARLAIRIDAASQAARQHTGTDAPPIAPLRIVINSARESLDADAIAEEDAIGRAMSLETVLNTALDASQGSVRNAIEFAHRLRMESLPQPMSERSAR